MCCTGGEDHFSSLFWVHTVNSKRDIAIESSDSKERKKEREACAHKKHVLIDTGVPTGQRQHSWDIAKELTKAVRNVEGVDWVWQGVYKSPNQDLMIIFTCIILLIHMG